jgi:hypothetical protein
MGGACNMHGGDDKCIQHFLLESLKGREHSKYVGINGRIILKWILGYRFGGYGLN